MLFIMTNYTTEGTSIVKIQNEKTFNPVVLNMKNIEVKVRHINFHCSQ